MPTKKFNKIINFHFIALASHGLGLSGGDRIYIEFAKYWSKSYKVTIHTWKEGFIMSQRQNLVGSKNLKFKIYNLELFCKFGFLPCYLARIILGIKLGLKLRLDLKLKFNYVYSSSEFLMDSLCAWIIKLRYPRIIWAASWYQTAPKPWVKRGSVFYWLTQVIVRPLITKYADFVLVNNELEKKEFPKLNKNKKVIVVLGAVDLENIKNYKLKSPNYKLKYDAVFQGRFHPQKGVLELIDIWKKVVNIIPKALLAMIGDGPLMKKVRFKIYDLGLENNIKLLGYVFDGPKKYNLFLKSKIVVHPAIYDSGGMASLEAMAFGLPCVGFNLKSYQSYYPKGMLKVKIGDLKAFADTILMLLQDKAKRTQLSIEAFDLVNNNWTWKYRSNEILTKIIVQK